MTVCSDSLQSTEHWIFVIQNCPLVNRLIVVHLTIDDKRRLTQRSIPHSVCARVGLGELLLSEAIIDQDDFFPLYQKAERDNNKMRFSTH